MISGRGLPTVTLKVPVHPCKPIGTVWGHTLVVAKGLNALRVGGRLSIRGSSGLELVMQTHAWLRQ